MTDRPSNARRSRRIALAAVAVVGLTLAACARYESKRFEDDLNSRVLGAAVTADVRADWRVNGTASLWLAADNLFDAEVEVSETGTGIEGFGPPRTLSAGLRLAY